MNKNVLEWNEVEFILSNFYVWVNAPEAPWFRRAWQAIQQAGLAQWTNESERMLVLVRAVTVGLMYGEYFQLEREKYFDFDSLASELYWDKSFSHIRISLLAKDWIAESDGDSQELFTDALLALPNVARTEVFDALQSGFGDSVLLYVGLLFSKESDRCSESLDDLCKEVISESGTLLRGREEAFLYVVQGRMLAI